RAHPAPLALEPGGELAHVAEAGPARVGREVALDAPVLVEGGQEAPELERVRAAGGAGHRMLLLPRSDRRARRLTLAAARGLARARAPMLGPCSSSTRPPRSPRCPPRPRRARWLARCARPGSRAWPCSRAAW